jgi:hypothetical protein
MLYYDVLDEIAESVHIPNDRHGILHINSRDAWIELMVFLIDQGYLKGSYEELCTMAESWETVLYRRFSTLN